MVVTGIGLGKRFKAGLSVLPALAILLFAFAAAAAGDLAGQHQGVASCAGSTCHGRLVSSGKTVRQNELITWQDTSSAAGQHSRAWQVLGSARAEAITARLGLGQARDAGACLGCHGDAAGLRGDRFQISDGVGCEACHGGSGAWLASHYAVGASHADNLRRGMVALEDPKVRANVCLDCHFGSARTGQFVSHRMMAAGHPRLSFELDLFSALQRHYDIDADYAKRKQPAGGVKFWAVGQAMAVERALTLYADADHGQDGAFPEFYFFDCQSCHRRISDDPAARPAAEANPARPIPAGMPPFDDQNMIMLSAVAHLASPSLAERFDGDSRAFHAALTQDRGSATAAASRLASSARALSDAFAAHAFGRAETIAVLKTIMSGTRYTDYAGGAQAVMAADTLLNALVASGQLARRNAEAVRSQINRLHDAVRDPNAWRPAEFREAMQQLALAVGRF